MASIASIQFAAGVRAPVVGKKGLKAASSTSSFMGSAVAAPTRAVKTAAVGGLKVEAKYDAGVGVFGNKAGMTQLFTEDGLCVPVTVIAVQAGNVVTQVRPPTANTIASRAFRAPRDVPARRARSRPSRSRGARSPGFRGFRALARVRPRRPRETVAF